VKTKTIAKSFAHEDSGSTVHVVYERKTMLVELCVWESKEGDFVALDNEWMFEHQEADIDPIPELIEFYRYKEDD
jgi:hypothetical protein